MELVGSIRKGNGKEVSLWQINLSKDGTCDGDGPAAGDGPDAGPGGPGDNNGGNR